MPDNPYESPQVPPEKREMRVWATVGMLSLVAIPIAASAGTTLCGGGFTLALTKHSSPLLYASPMLGLAGMISVCAAAMRFLAKESDGSRRVSYFMATAGLLCATPISIVVAGFLMMSAIVPKQHGPDAFDIAKAWLGAFLACSIWSAGLWFGMNFRESK